MFRLKTVPWWMQNIAFLRMWLGQSLSTIGSQFTRIALIVMVTNLSDDPLPIAVVTIIQMVPILFSPLAGVYVDRWDKKTVMVVVDLARCLVVAGLMVVNQLWQVYLLAGAVSSLGIFFGPARGAVIPEIVKRENMTSAVSLSQLTSNAAVLIGPAAAGMAIALLGTRAAFAVDAVTFLIAAVNVALLPLPTVRANQVSTGNSPQDLLYDVRVGLSGLLKHPVLKTLTGLLFSIMLFSGLVNVAGMHYARNIIRLSETRIGLILSASGLGAVLASAYFSAFGKRHNEWKATYLSAFLLGLGFASYITAPRFYGMSVRIFLTGFFGCAMFIPVQSLLYQHTPADIRGRVLSIIDMMFSGIPLLGYVLAGIVTRHVPAHLVVSCCGCIMVVITATALRLTETGRTNTVSRV